MDFSSYWQENRNFALGALGGALCFLIAFLVIDSSVGSARDAARSALLREEGKLRQSYFSASDEAKARADHEQLEAAQHELLGAAAFVPRPEFVLRPDGGSASNQYFGRVDRAQRELELLAGRARCSLPEGLGLEPLKTNELEVIARQLEAVDLLDRALRRAIEARVTRVQRVEIQLDPTLNSRQGVGLIERTRVLLRLNGAPEAVTRFLHSTQRHGGGPLLVDSYDARVTNGREDEVTLDITLVAVRLHQPSEENN